MTREEALLMKRTAWRNTLPREFRLPTAKDKIYVDKAVKMLSALACLNSVMLDIEEELVEHNLFRQGLKKSVKDATKNVTEVYDFAFRVMHDANEGATRVYNDKYDLAYNKIQESIFLEPPERAYNIAINLCRIIQKLNEEVRGKYDLKPLERLYRIPEHIATDKIKTYNLNFIENVL